MLNKYIKYLNKWIINYCKRSKMQGVVIGISGGIDSAVIAKIASLNNKIKVIGVFLDIDNSKLDKECLELLKKQNDYEIIERNLINIYQQYQLSLNNINDKLILSNLKARIRMSVLYAFAQKEKMLVCGTSNLDELYLGYFTKYGDGGCDIAPLAYLNKAQIFECAKILNIPEKIINRPPSASLYEGQTDEQELGLTYSEIDNFLKKEKTTSNAKKKIKHLHKINLHKLFMPVRPGKKPLSN